MIITLNKIDRYNCLKKNVKLNTSHLFMNKKAKRKILYYIYFCLNHMYEFANMSVYCLTSSETMDKIPDIDAVSSAKQLEIKSTSWIVHFGKQDVFRAQ